MSLTRPTGEQLTFNSSKTGVHILDDYLEAVEAGNRTLADLISEVFDDTTGDLKAFDFRLNNNQIEYKIGTGPWTPIHDYSAFRQEVEDWARKTGATVGGVDYSAKEYAIGTTVPAGSAKKHATDSANSASAASTSATNASNSASAAGTSETNAASSASAASTSETNASNSASAAATSETNAGSSATNAAASESAAATSANNASTSATNAASSASTASTSASNASTSETNAASSATAASTSETNAANSEALAQNWAEHPEDTEVATGQYSAFHWSQKAANAVSAVDGTALFDSDGDTTVRVESAVDEDKVRVRTGGIERVVIDATGLNGRDVAADGTKLDGIETNATADQTASEIKTAYESNTDTNAFTDSEQTKLTGIEAGAQVNPASTDALSEGTTNLYYTSARASSDAPVQSVNGQTGAVTVSGSLLLRDFVATGTISTGDVVALRADGTVEVVKETTYPNSVGTPTVFESADSRYISATYDSVNGKVVIAYRDNGNSFYGTAVVGTVSGNSISFGTPTVFESANTSDISITYDSANGKVVIAYRDNGNSVYGTAIVGTASGDSISFGTPTVFESADTSNTSATYDSVNGKVVIAYRDDSNADYGTAVVGTVSGDSISFGTPTVFESSYSRYVSAIYDSVNGKVVIAYSDNGSSKYGTAVVGTVSSDSISFGTPTVFESADSRYVSATYDSAAGKVVIAYRDGGNFSYGTAVVGTVSGDSISFGTPTVFDSTNSYEISVTYDSVNGKVVIAYANGGNSSYGTAVVGTVSGDSISFGTPTVFESDNSTSSTATYDSASGKVVIAYRDGGNSFYGTSVVWQTSYVGTNADDWIGVSQASLTDTQTGTVVIRGAVDANQSGLTPNNVVYLSDTGSLTTTDNGRKLGRALASDTILLAAE